MKKYLNNKILLLIIVLLAVFLRFYDLSNIAPALNWDEAALGYNAYSLGIDGKDEFGKFLPLSYLESYGDFKPPIYSYLDVIPVKIFGLNEFGVRFPSAFFGTLTVFLTFFLVKEIFYKARDQRKVNLVAVLSMLFLAISPWHIMLSRGAFEANVATFFLACGVLSFLIAVNRNMKFLILSALFFALSIYTFNTSRVFAPLILGALAFAFRQRLWDKKKETILAIAVGLIIALPSVPFLLSPQASLRFREVNIFSDERIVLDSNKEIENDGNAAWSRLIHNRRIGYLREFSEHYLDNLNPSFLFTKGDGNPRFSTQDVGQMYLWDLPFFILGIFMIFRLKEGYYWLIPLWLILAIIPAATARETPHALRVETTLPFFQILTAYGFVSALGLLKKYKKQFVYLFLILLFVNFYYFYHGYTKHYAREFSSEWQYPYREIVPYVVSEKQKYERIVVTESLGRPYIYFLLYGKEDPKKFRENSKIEREAFGFVHVKSFDKLQFEKFIDENNLQDNTLYIDVPKNLPSGVEKLKTFKYLDGITALIAYKK